MRSIGVVLSLILRQFPVHRRHGQGTLIKRIELIAIGAVGALDKGVVSRFFRGQHIQPEISNLQVSSSGVRLTILKLSN